MTTALKLVIDLTQKLVRFPSVSHQSNEAVSQCEVTVRGESPIWLIPMSFPLRIGP